NRFIGGLLTIEECEDSHPLVLHQASIEDVAAAASSRADTLTHDHKVSLCIDKHLPAAAIDRTSAIEVVYMLLDNASKYSPPGSAICLEAKRHDPLHVCIRVSDKGPGIPPNLRERVFDRFFRIPNREPRDRARRSLGVGLSLAKRLIETQGGKIWIESSE